VIRQLAASEWKLLREVRLRGLGEDPEWFEMTVARAREFPDQHWKDTAELYGCALTAARFLAEDPAGAVAGLASAQFDHSGDPSKVYLGWIWIAHESRGKGLGRALVEGVGTWARSRGATLLFAFTSERNVAGRALFTSSGFAIDRQEDGALLMVKHL